MQFFLSLTGIAVFGQAVFALSINDTYDYIVVGGGLSGLVVANRLSEDRNKTVLVIENGYVDTTALPVIPYLGAERNTASMYPLTSAPNPYLKNLTTNIAVANVLGGGSIVNGMMFDRGADADYNAWEELGNPGWSWNGLEPYFKKAVTFTPPSESTTKEFGITYDQDAYGHGPVQVSISSFMYPDSKRWFDAWGNEDVPTPKEGFKDPVGVYWAPCSINNKTATRSQAKNSYYDPITDRKNLLLLLGTHVDEVLFSNTTSDIPTANGVKITNRKTSVVSNVYASKEVVLASGAIFTPHLLMKSGIGPASVLQDAKVNIKVDLPGVGSNFQDHATAYLSFNASNLTFPNPDTMNTNSSFNASAWAQYETDREGPVSACRGNALAMLPLSDFSSKASTIATEAESQNATAFLPDRYTKTPALLAGFKRQREILAKQFRGDERYKAAIGEYPVGIKASVATLLKPLSRGTITLNKTHPSDSPVVTFNTLQNPVDRAVLGDLVRFFRLVVRDAPSLAQYQPVTEIVPGPQYISDDEIVEGLLQKKGMAASFAHPSGSCPMMPLELGGCVSSDLKVYGVKGLSVVDASILPMIPGAHLQATMYAVGEKAAELIKERA